METKPLRVLSLFDGISCARVALGDRPTSWYGASEIDINAIAVSFDNHSDITPLGDVCDVSGVKDIDLLIAGSPCTDLSIAKKDRQGLKGDHSKLFYEFLRILRETRPRYFILENVASMKKEDRDEITKLVGVAPIMIDASLVSAQSRKRYFWTNIAVKGLPEDRNIKLKDILEQNVAEEFYTNTTAKRVMKEIKKATTSGVGLYSIGHLGDTNAQANRIYDTEGKACTLSANGGGLGAKTGLYQIIKRIRKLTPIECERLQNLPDDYTKCLGKTQRYRCLGNAFNVEVIKFILSFLQ